MLLRSVIQQVRNQEWVAIGIDFVIVVIGVFIGIQVSNWNTDRQEQRQAEIYTERLRAELELEFDYTRSLLDYMETTLAAGNAAYLGLVGESSDSDESILINAFRASQYNWYERRRAVFDEIVSAGALSRVNDTGLREAAVGLYNTPLFSIMQEEGVSAEYRRRFREAIEPATHEALRANCGDKELDTGGRQVTLLTLAYDCETGLDKAALARGLSALRADPRLLPALRLRSAQRAGRLVDMEVTLRTLGVTALFADAKPYFANNEPAGRNRDE